MGCLHSTMDSPGHDVVPRFAARKRFMKQAIAHRHDFSASHSAYLRALRDTGAALRQLAEGEMRHQRERWEEGKQQPASVCLLPPPPLPSSAPSVPPPLASSSSPSPSSATAFTCEASSPNSGENLWPSESLLPDGTPLPQLPPVSSSSWDFFDPFRPSSPPLHLQEQQITKHAQEQEANTNLMPKVYQEEAVLEGENDQRDKADTFVEEKKGGADMDLVARLKGRKNLLEIIKELDDELLKASAGGGDVSRVLETRRAHFHTNMPAHNRRHKSRSARVFSAFNWNWSKPSKEDIERTLHESNAIGSHALTLERLLAWEKKLYSEVKEGESLRSEHQRKCYLLRSQEARGDDLTTIDKTRAEIKRLHSLILVSFQGVESTIAAIQRLRDDELYPQLAELVEALADMWKTMYICHAQQKQIAFQIRNLESVLSQARDPTSESHHKATIQLECELTNWYNCFCKLVKSHREYITALNGWLCLNLIPMDTYKLEKEEHSEDLELSKDLSNPKIFGLCEEWQRSVDRLPDKVPSEAIKSLVIVVHAMVCQQADEIRQRRKAENLAKQLEKKCHSLQSLESKYMHSTPQKTASACAETETIVRTPIVRDPIAEKRAAIDSFKRKLENEKTKHSKCIQDTGVLTMNNLQTGLPGVFEAMTGFAAVSAQAFEALHDHVRTVKN